MGASATGASPFDHKTIKRRRVVVLIAPEQLHLRPVLESVGAGRSIQLFRLADDVERIARQPDDLLAEIEAHRDDACALRIADLEPDSRHQPLLAKQLQRLARQRMPAQALRVSRLALSADGVRL